MVVSSSAALGASESRALRLQLSTSQATGADMGPAQISQLVTAISIDCGALGRVDMQNFSAPERTWWANPQTVCARYRAAFSGHATLEAVVDIQAWAGGRALVEVLVENCKMSTATPVKPTAASYATASVAVNGTAVASVNGNGGPEGNHAAFRAWYARHWVGGDPELRATQIHTELQLHPLLFKCDQANTADLVVYAGDTYTPWSTGRQRGTNMGAGGDHPSIGPLPQWESRALQSGDARAWRATEVSALACLGYGINYRDSATGLVPTFAQLSGKSQQSNWPVQFGPNSNMEWKDSHHPAAGLMAFIGRPTPVFIELAQKVAVWNGTWSTFADGGTQQPTGVFGAAYQLRGKAWCLRSLVHAIFITPQALPWKAAGATSLAQNVAYLDAWRTDPKAKLNTMWVNRVDRAISVYNSVPRVNIAGWQYHYLITELHKAASAKLLNGSDQTAIQTLADWCALQPVRWVNEQAATGAWRYVPYVTVLGRAGETPPTLNSYTDWGTHRADWMTDLPPTVAGAWFTTGGETLNTYAAFGANTTAVAGYTTYFWSALVAAVERGVPGADQAWTTVQNQLTGLSTWRSGFGADPRWGSQPRIR